MKSCACSFRSFGFTAICIASDPDHDILADIPWRQNHPENRCNLSCFYYGSQLWMGSIRIWFPSILPVSFRSNVCPVLRGIRFFRYVTVLNFQHSDLLIMPSSSIPYNLNIAIKPVRIQLFYSCPFYSVVVLPKNKIRSIINSFLY
jgi:hypothetical protein